MSFLDDFENLDIITAGEFSTVAYVHSAKVVQAPAQIQGIYDNRAEPIFDAVGMEQTVEGRRITFLVQTADTEYLRHGDQLSIDGNNHAIVGIDPTDDGKLSELVLKETEFVNSVSDDESINVEVSNFVVGENVAQYRIVYRNLIDSKIYLADATQLEKIYAIGAAEQNILAFETGTVRYAGYIKNTSWNFDPIKPIYLGTNGNITQTMMTNAIAIVHLGQVISPTEIILDIEDPIFIN